jgi:hypothetical protein
MYQLGSRWLCVVDSVVSVSTVTMLEWKEKWLRNLTVFERDGAVEVSEEDDLGFGEERLRKWHSLPFWLCGNSRTGGNLTSRMKEQRGWRE